MNRLEHKRKTGDLRKSRIRAVVRGTSERPRLSVRISSLHVTAQIIDDTKQTTVVAATTAGESKLKGNMTEKAAFVGTAIAKKALAKKISRVVFDRGSRVYHGRIKALADAARDGGLKF